METLIQTTEKGEVKLPDIVKIKFGEKIFVFDNSQAGLAAKRENASNVLANIDKTFEGLSVDLDVENEDDVMELVREVRYNEHQGKDN